MKKRIIEECDKIKELLILKNEKYGNTALEPERIFSTAEATEQLKVRIDDKIGRIKKNGLVDDEDTITDLIGYLILYKISINKKELAIKKKCEGKTFFTEEEADSITKEIIELFGLKDLEEKNEQTNMEKDRIRSDTDGRSDLWFSEPRTTTRR